MLLRSRICRAPLLAALVLTVLGCGYDTTLPSTSPPPATSDDETALPAERTPGDGTATIPSPATSSEDGPDLGAPAGDPAATTSDEPIKEQARSTEAPAPDSAPSDLPATDDPAADLPEE
jgi:hypothetical protein